MKATERKLRKVIRETLDRETRWKLQQDMKAMLENDYDKVDSNTRYPYGRNRGDVRSSTIYTRKDGQPVQPDDIAIFTQLSDEQKKDSYAGLSGVFMHKVSEDGMTLTVNYYRHTSG